MRLRRWGRGEGFHLCQVRVPPLVPETADEGEGGGQQPVGLALIPLLIATMAPASVSLEGP